MHVLGGSSASRGSVWTPVASGGGGRSGPLLWGKDFGPFWLCPYFGEEWPLRLEGVQPPGALFSNPPHRHHAPSLGPPGTRYFRARFSTVGLSWKPSQQSTLDVADAGTGWLATFLHLGVPRHTVPLSLAAPPPQGGWRIGFWRGQGSAKKHQSDLAPKATNIF